MNIVELFSVSEKQVDDFRELFLQMEPGIHITPETLARSAESQGSHLFALMDDNGKIIGSATLCVSDLPTGRKACVEAVVVKTEYRSKHLGKQLMEHLIDYARNHFVGINLCLTSHPRRVAANALYKSLGFKQRETNVYQLEIGTK